MARNAFILLLLSLTALLASCSGPGVIDATTPAPGIGLGEQLAGEGLLSAEVIYSRNPIIAQYDRFEGGSSNPSRDAGEIQVFGDDETWMIERYRVPRDESKAPELERRVLLGEGADGSVLLKESTGGDRGLTTTFEPPVRLAAPLMRQGETIEGVFTPRIRDRSGERNETGEGTSKVTYAGRQRIETPLGTFDAELIMTELTFDFGMVKVHRVARQWIAMVRSGRPMIVAEDITERQTVFGFTTTSRTRLAIRSLVR
jgi:hypothetical protein